MTLLGFHLIPASTHTLNWEKSFIYKSPGRKEEEDVVCFYCVINIKIKQDEVKQSPAFGPVAWETITSYQKKGIPWKQQL